MAKRVLDYDPLIIGAEVTLTVKAGRGLVAKDGNFFGKKTSDPYVSIEYMAHKLGQTEHCAKTLEPTWDNAAYNFTLAGRSFRPEEAIILRLFDYDKGLLDSDDPMGQVRIPLKSLLGGHVVDKWFPVTTCEGCSNATGEMHVSISVVLRKTLSLQAHDSMTC